MEWTIEENRKLKKLLVYLLELSPVYFLASKNFSLFCMFFDIEEIKTRYYPKTFRQGWEKSFLFSLILHVYKERSDEFADFVIKFVIDCSTYNEFKINLREAEVSIRNDLIRFGFTHEEVYGKIPVDNQPIPSPKTIAYASATPKDAKFPRSKYIFIVHGHDEELKEKVARLITNAGLNPIILHEQPNKGRSILQKLRDHSEDAGYAIVLFTPDDVGCSQEEFEKDTPDFSTRARQNVILELGYFLGLLEDRLVCVIHKDVEEMPTDYKGIVYIKYDKGKEWKTDLLKELDEIGYEIDYKNALK
ncbi:MAG: nucleotide-binding protein [Methanoregula sp.]|jgi:predicted nucleotide-binding protein